MKYRKEERRRNSVRNVKRHTHGGPPGPAFGEGPEEEGKHNTPRMKIGQRERKISEIAKGIRSGRIRGRESPAQRKKKGRSTVVPS